MLLSDEDIWVLIKSRLIHAQKQHPEGASFYNLVSEVDEVEKSIKEGDTEHEIYELIDVITVAFRMIKRAQLRGKQP